MGSHERAVGEISAYRQRSHSSITGKNRLEAENNSYLARPSGQKEVVGVNQNQKVYTFTPLYSQSECQRAEAKSFLNRIYGGTMKSMLVHFFEEESLTEEEIKELRNMLNEKSDKR